MALSVKTTSTLSYAAGIAFCLAGLVQIAVHLYKPQTGNLPWTTVGFNLVAGILWFVMGTMQLRGKR